jgi:hypothetical protein
MINMDRCLLQSRKAPNPHGNRIGNYGLVEYNRRQAGLVGLQDTP